MPEEDFDIAGLAAYLHLDPAQVARLAERGKIPGRRVSGQWRFAQADVRSWMEKQIGLSDEAELTKMEDALDRSAGAESRVSIAELLPVEAMAVPLPSRTRTAVVTDIVEVAARTGWLWNPDKMAEAVRSREAMHPTALENGVALLHPRRPMPSILGQSFIAFGRTIHGIPFGARELTDLFFLILATEDAGYLRVLARLSRMIGDADFLARLREAPDAAEARRVIGEREKELE
jgi:PTS system nitrogen regulatory IIA component